MITLLIISLIISCSEIVHDMTTEEIEVIEYCETTKDFLYINKEEEHRHFIRIYTMGVVVQMRSYLSLVYNYDPPFI